MADVFTQRLRCDAGHEITAPTSVTVRACRVCVHGKPCTAPVRFVGEGSRARNRALVEVDA
jgi:hypothetical protein